MLGFNLANARNFIHAHVMLNLGPNLMDLTNARNLIHTHVMLNLGPNLMDLTNAEFDGPMVVSQLII